MEKLKDDPSKHGIYIADRVSKVNILSNNGEFIFFKKKNILFFFVKTWEQTAAQISHIMYRFTQLTRRERIELRNRTERYVDNNFFKRK